MVTRTVTFASPANHTNGPNGTTGRGLKKGKGRHGSRPSFLQLCGKPERCDSRHGHYSAKN